MNSQLIHRHATVVHTRSPVARDISPAGHSFNTSAVGDGRGRRRHASRVVANTCGCSITDLRAVHVEAEESHGGEESYFGKIRQQSQGSN